MSLTSCLACDQIKYGLLKAKPWTGIIRYTYTTQTPDLPKEIVEAVEIKPAPPPPKLCRMSSYQLFIQDRYPYMSRSLRRYGEGFHYISEDWKELPEDEKKEYEDRAFKMREESKKAVLEYKRQYSDLEIAKYELESKREVYEREKIAYQSLIKKAFPRRTGYNIFVSEFPNSTLVSHGYDHRALFKDLSKKASEAWKNLPQEEKEKYNKRAKEKQETRSSELSM